MQAAWLCWAIAAAGVWPAQLMLAAEQHSTAVVKIEAKDEHALQDALLSLTEDRLRPEGLFVDRHSAWMKLSVPLPATRQFEVQAGWLAEAQAPALPLSFELWPSFDPDAPAATQAPGAQPIHVTLAVSLLRDVPVAARRLHKGSVITCEDFAVQRRRLRDAPPRVLAQPCETVSGTVALRDIAVGDVLRDVDVGPTPDVMAGEPVRLNVKLRGISVAATAIALSDARVGDEIEVRLQHPARTLKTRVTAPGSVQLLDGSL
jgi:flagella basal body P-ring formation protein FlgA